MYDRGTVIGIDYSFTCPAVCAVRPDRSTHWYVNYRPKGNPYPALPDVTWTLGLPGDNEVLRFIELGNWVLDIVDNEKPHFIVLEDYAFAAAGRITQLAENGGVLKAKLLESRRRVHVVAPTTMKKFATGSGRAQKEDIVAAFNRALPHTSTWHATCHPKAVKVGSPVADIADAYFLAQYGINHLTPDTQA